jgi:hypothetical protein
VSIEVISTLRAQQQAAALDRTHSRAFAGFIDDLLVGPHDTDPSRDVCGELYALLDALPPDRAARRRGPRR